MNEQLRRYYESVYPRILEIQSGSEEVSWPLFLEVPPEYAQLKRKLMIVGQETRGWGRSEILQSLPNVLAEYSGFGLGRDYRSTPFWQAANRLDRELNPDGPARSYLWSNLVKVSQRKTRPCLEVEQRVCELGLLEKEIEITRPEIIVFFTGAKYDKRLLETFPGLELVPLDSKWLCRARGHPLLPTHSYRTYHPAFLRKSKNWGVLDAIVRYSSQPSANATSSGSGS